MLDKRPPWIKNIILNEIENVCEIEGTDYLGGEYRNLVKIGQLISVNFAYFAAN